MNTQFNKPNNTSLISQTLFFKSYFLSFFPSPVIPSMPSSTSTLISQTSERSLEGVHWNLGVNPRSTEHGVRALSSPLVQPILEEEEAEAGAGVMTTFQGEALVCPKTIKDRGFCFLY